MAPDGPSHLGWKSLVLIGIPMCDTAGGIENDKLAINLKLFR